MSEPIPIPTPPMVCHCGQPATPGKTWPLCNACRKAKTLEARKRFIERRRCLRCLTGRTERGDALCPRCLPNANTVFRPRPAARPAAI